MLRKLLVIALLLSTVLVTYAQKKDKKKRKKKKDKTEQVAEEAKIDYKAEGAPMPDMALTTRKGRKLTHKDFDNNANLFVMIFNPTCDHCQEQTINFEKNIDLFDKSKILMVASPGMIDYLQFYNNVTRYFEYPKITVAVDSAGFIDKVFTYEHLPQINVYDKKRNLLKIFTGDTPIEALKPYIE